MTDFIIFPTIFRSKLPRELAFPAGAEALSAALAGVPQAAAFGCHFTGGGYNQIHKERDNELVLHIGYTKRARSFYDGVDAAARGVLNARWEIHVYAVPTALRHGIKTELFEQVLPHTIRPWLMANPDFGQVTGSKGFRVSFNYQEKRLFAELLGRLEPDVLR